MRSLNWVGLLVYATSQILRSHILITFWIVTDVSRLCNSTNIRHFVEHSFFIRVFELCAIFQIPLRVLLRIRLCELLPYDHVSLRNLVGLLRRFGADQLLAHRVCKVKIDCIVVIPNESRDGLSHVLHHGKLDQERDQVQKGIISGVIIPGEDGQGTLWLKHVRCRGVVDDDWVL